MPLCNPSVREPNSLPAHLVLGGAADRAPFCVAEDVQKELVGASKRVRDVVKEVEKKVEEMREAPRKRESVQFVANGAVEINMTRAYKPSSYNKSARADFMFHVANGKYHSRIKLVRAIKLLWPKKPPRQGDETTQMTLSRTGTLRPPAQQTLSFKPAAAAPSSAAAAAETHVKPEEAIPA